MLRLARIDADAQPTIYALHEGRVKAFGCHEGQGLTWELADLDSIRVLIVMAGWRSGKTEIGPPWLKRKIRKHGPQDYQVVTTTFKLFNNRILPLMRAQFERRDGLVKYRASDKLFEFTDEGLHRVFGTTTEGQCRVLMGYAEDPDSLEASTLGAVWADEAGQKHFKEDSHETLESRLMTTGGPILYTSRPYLRNWFTDLAKSAEYRAEWAAAGPDEPLVLKETGDRHSARVALVSYSSLMNPTFEKAEYFRKKEEMPAWRHRLKYDGVFTKPAGAIYDCFDRSLHTCKRFQVPASWPRYWGVDFGKMNLAGVMLAENPVTKHLYAYSVYYPKAARNTKKHIERMVELDRSCSFDDGDVGQRLCYGGAPSETEGQGQRLHFTAEGLPVMEPRTKGVDSQIACVYAEIAGGRLSVFDDLEPLCSDLEDYSVELDDEGEPTDAILNKSVWHRLDGLRYVVSSVRPMEEWSGPSKGNRSGEKEPPKNEPHPQDEERYAANKARIARLKGEDEGKRTRIK